MIKSMTAFARVESSAQQGEVVWEIKSVNHRYLEPGFKLPEEFRQLEPDLRGRLASKVKRGKIDLGLRYRLDHSTPAEIALNADLVRKLRGVEQEVLKIVHEGHSLSVSDILRWPGVVEESTPDLGPLRDLALQGFDQALEQLVDSRQREGQSLHEMIASRCQRIREIIDEVQQRRPVVLESIRNKWRAQLDERVEQWSQTVDEGRLEQELVLMIQKLDVEEELDRLQAHVSEVETVLARDEAVGRRLDFLMQELNREANTLSSKSQDSETTRQAVDLKVLIEQMREQVQNIE
jgi:uncharacterized protein (TIGR00255 family)